MFCELRRGGAIRDLPHWSPKWDRMFKGEVTHPVGDAAVLPTADAGDQPTCRVFAAVEPSTQIFTARRIHLQCADAFAVALGLDGVAEFFADVEGTLDGTHVDDGAAGV
jgi:hypothetical protein